MCIQKMTDLKIYNEYALHGVDEYYKKYAKDYYNPHEGKINEILDDVVLVNYLCSYNKILDFACGDGLVSQKIKSKNKNIVVKGSDPYFNNKYCDYNFSFDDIICGKLLEKFDVVICSYAYHLLSPNKRYDFLTQLAIIAKIFIIISPSKKITIKHQLWDEIENKRINKISIIVIKNKYYCIN